MAEIDKIQGPSGSPEHLGKKEDRTADSDKFKKEMQKVEKISETDAEQKKKRKRKEETEGEEEAVDVGPTTPKELVTPFSLKEQKTVASPGMTLQEGTAQPFSSSTPGTPPFLINPSTTEIEDDSGMLEEEAFSQPSPPSVLPLPSMPMTLPKTPPEKESFLTPPSSSTTSETKTPLNDPSKEKKEEKKHRLAPSVDISKSNTSELQKENTPTTSLEVNEKKDQEGIRTLLAQSTPIPQNKEEEIPLEGTLSISSHSVPPSAPVDQEKKVGKEKEVQDISVLVQPPPELHPLAQAPPSPFLETLPPYTRLHPAVMELFDRMVGVMTVMHMADTVETTITLNDPKFASSVFFGTQIIIQEFSTAPKAFNVQINTPPPAMTLLQGNAEDLMAAFQHGNFNFRINRVEMGYLAERAAGAQPLFKRKEKVSEKQSKETGP